MLYTVSPFRSGLNNQKFSILGGIAFAMENGGKFRAPEYLVDFDPDLPGSEIEFSACFDKDVFESALKELNLFQSEIVEDAVYLNAGDMFKHGCGLQRKTPFSSDFGKALNFSMNSMVPSENLKKISKEISMHVSGGICLQLRIESDWQRYMRKKIADHGLLDGEEAVLSAEEIFSKIYNYPDLRKFKLIYACCDELDLIESKDDIRSVGGRFGFDIIFKSDLVANIDLSLPKSKFQNSIIDFDVALGANAYVGLTRSTFSNCLAYVAGSTKKQYIFNNVGSSVMERIDKGMHLSPASIGKLLKDKS